MMIVSIALLSSCNSSHYLSPTPNIYLSPNHYPDENISNKSKTTLSEILFVTDRANESSDNKLIKFGVKRSDCMSLGSIMVQYGDRLSWNYLKNQSEIKSRSVKIPLKIETITNLVNFPATPLPFAFKNGNVILDYKANQLYQQATNKFRQILKFHLNKTKRHDVILFVHGFNNSFAEAGLSLADIWHFTGRIGVPIFYTWPAGNPGLLGYFKDRESGEFTVYHLKETIRIIAETNEVDKIHIIAHSRGTDIATTALRELVIEARAKGETPRRSLKIENLILAAPDLDFDVVSQRLIAEKFGPAIKQITVYMNPGDNVLGLSEFIMSGSRFGKITKDNLTQNERKIFSRIKNVHFIDVKGVHNFNGHNYYRKNSGVLSDIAIVIREGAKPGEKNRNLLHDRINFWKLPKGYPLKNTTNGEP